MFLQRRNVHTLVNKRLMAGKVLDQVLADLSRTEALRVERSPSRKPDRTL
jgi:hypothetical protein